MRFIFHNDFLVARDSSIVLLLSLCFMYPPSACRCMLYPRFAKSPMLISASAAVLLSIGVVGPNFVDLLVISVVLFPHIILDVLVLVIVCRFRFAASDVGMIDVVAPVSAIP